MQKECGWGGWPGPKRTGRQWHAYGDRAGSGSRVCPRREQREEWRSGAEDLGFPLTVLLIRLFPFSLSTSHVAHFTLGMQNARLIQCKMQNAKQTNTEQAGKWGLQRTKNALRIFAGTRLICLFFREHLKGESVLKVTQNLKITYIKYQCCLMLIMLWFFNILLFYLSFLKFKNISPCAEIGVGASKKIGLLTYKHEKQEIEFSTLASVRARKEEAESAQEQLMPRHLCVISG